MRRGGEKFSRPKALGTADAGLKRLPATEVRRPAARDDHRLHGSRSRRRASSSPSLRSRYFRILLYSVTLSMPERAGGLA